MYMKVPAPREGPPTAAVPVGKGSSSMSAPAPRLKNDGVAGVSVKPSMDWIVYGKYADRKKKKLHTTRAAELRMRLRQIVRAWHCFVEGTRLVRQATITSVMVRSGWALELQL